MDLLSPLSAVVLTYREVGPDDLGKVAEEMRTCVNVLGRRSPMFVLHTCGRVEAYLYGASAEDVDSLVARYRKYVGSVQVLSGVEAARHLFRVAAGLDSMLIGETDILGQLEEAFDRQVKAGYTRGLLKVVVERAVRVGKRVRTETAISRGPRGLGSLAVTYVARRLDLSKASVAVLGAGAVGAGLAMELAARGVGRLVVLNRTFEKAVEVARRVGAEARPLSREEVARCLVECDVVFSSVHTFDYVVDSVPQGARVKLIVDLGVPQSVAPGLPVEVVRIGDLRQLAEEFNRERAGEVAKAEAIVEEELGALEKALARRYVEEEAARLLEEAFRVAEEEGARAGCPGAVLASRSTVKRVLLPLIHRLKEMAEDGRVEEAVALIRQLEALTPTLLTRGAPQSVYNTQAAGATRQRG
ncbi:MAG: glutamyl-tRNA reductase [Pyrobaculum sp.]